MKINWKMVMHVNADTEHVLTYRDGCHGKCTNHFHIDGDKREFRKETDLIEAIRKG